MAVGIKTGIAITRLLYAEVSDGKRAIDKHFEMSTTHVVNNVIKTKASLSPMSTCPPFTNEYMLPFHQ